jgi:transcription antitermination factor NusG
MVQRHSPKDSWSFATNERVLVRDSFPIAKLKMTVSLAPIAPARDRSRWLTPFRCASMITGDPRVPGGSPFADWSLTGCEDERFSGSSTEAMPILPAEPDLYPPDLWEEGQTLLSTEGRWWCLHAKPRQEKAAARDLRARSVAFYLPQVVREDRTPQGRKIRSVVPLFTSYLFLRGNDHDRLEALRGNRLANILEVPDQEGLARDLRQIHQMLSSGLAVVPEPVMPVGARVRIKTGPLAGMEGTVMRRGKRDQFVAVVQFLGRGATVDLEDWQVELIG